MQIKVLFTSWIIVFFLIGCSQIKTSKNHNGISFVAPANKIDQQPFTVLKTSTNCNSVAIIPYAFSHSAEKPDVIYGNENQWWGERPTGVIETIRLAHQAGLSVLLKPQLWIKGGLYTGHFDPTTEEGWSIFESGYFKYVIEFAKIAEETKVATFCIGTEWGKFVEKRPNFWFNLIDSVKHYYHGSLTYASNWDDYKDVPFWHQLDFIGVDAYFPLSRERLPKKSAIIAKLDSINYSLKSFSSNYKKPILFTEFGYRSMDFGLAEPWDSYTERSANMHIQQTALDAFYEVFWQENYIAGGYLWKWFSQNKKAGGMRDIGYTPQNKPALNVINKWYSKN